MASNNGTLNLLQSNLGRGSLATGEALKLAEKVEAPIMLIQEPYSFCFKVAGLGTYTNQILTGHKDREKPWACVLNRVLNVLNRDYMTTLLRDVSTSHCVCAHVSGPTGSFYVISAYLQYSLPVEVVLQQVHKALCRIGNKGVIIGMYANAVSSLWSWRDIELEDERGDAVERFMAQWNLAALNRSGELCTFETGKRDIDVTMSDFNFVRKLNTWRVLDTVPSTDPRPILIAFGNLQKVERVRQSRFNVSRANWELFSDEILRQVESLSSIQGKIKRVEEVDEMAITVENIIIEAGNISMKRKMNFQRSVPWWSPDLTQAKRETNRLRRDYQREKDTEIREEKRQKYREKRRKYTRNALKEKKLSWQNFVEITSEENPYGIVYKMARNKMNLKSAVVNVSKDGSYTKNWRETTQAIFEGLFGGEDEALERYYVSDQVEDEVVSQAQLGRWKGADITRAVRSMRNRKSPGRDLIEVEMLRRAVGSGLLPVLVELYNGCLRFGVFPKIWKTGIIRVLLKSPSKDPMEIRSYRPVCLLTVLSKVLERLIRNELRPIIMHPDYASMR